MTDTGNAAQTRVIAEQLFAVWEAKRASENTKQRASWPAWLGLALTIITLIFSAGSLRSEFATQDTRISKVEERLDNQDRAIALITDRLARIETKLDLALDQRKGGQ